MKAAFLDTSYVLALELSNDQNHRAALKHWRSTIKSLPSLVTTSYIFDEIVTYFNSHGYHSKAIEVGDRLLSSSSVQLVHVDEDLFNQAWQYFQDHQDKRYSFTDCVSFVVMENLEIETAFAFDKHFVQARFKRVP